MIKVSYISDYDSNDICEVASSDDDSLVKVLANFMRVCFFAGYASGSFDNIFKEAAADIDDRYSAYDYVTDAALD